MHLAIIQQSRILKLELESNIFKESGVGIRVGSFSFRLRNPACILPQEDFYQHTSNRGLAFC